jgi:hypothetical protein
VFPSAAHVSIFGDHFLLIGEGGAELDEFFGLIEIRGSPELCWAE